MLLVRLATIIISVFLFAAQAGFCADSYRVNNLFIDNSDRLIYIQGDGNFKTGTTNYIPIPSGSGNSVNLINNITIFKMPNPNRYVVDIPNAILNNPSRTYKFKNSVISSLVISQFSVNPNIVRLVITAEKESDLLKFRTYSNGKDIFIKYATNIIDNAIQYKFYTPYGDSDKSANLQNTSAVYNFNNSDETFELTPRLQTRYYLGKISQNSDGLILRGLGSISMQKATYNPDNTQASVILDSASVSSNLDNKTFKIPTTVTNSEATLTINRLNAKKVKLTLNGEALRDYRFVVSPDGQSLFVAHRTYVVATPFSSELIKAQDYKVSDTSAGYRVFEFKFNKAVTYDVFELNDNFYLDINNLGDYNEATFLNAIKNLDTKVQAIKISSDKTRYIIPLKTLNFAYGNIESNGKSIKLCFKNKAPAEIKNEVIIANTNVEPKKEEEIKDKSKSENINVIYIPKEDDENKKVKNERFKKKKENPTISAMKKVVLDPGHGGADSGAISGSLYEKTLNLKIAKMVEERLTKKDIHVYMTRAKDETLTLEERVEFSNEVNPDIYVSIHANSTLQGDSYGLETHYYKDDSYELAKKIHSHFASEKNLNKWETKDRGVIKSRFYVINHTEAPSILIEIGFISNAIEKEKLLNSKRQEEIADSITKGILEYLK